jgi:hypothetical protein
MSQDDELFAMSDEDLEAAYRAAIADQNSPETAIEESTREEFVTETEAPEEYLQEETATEVDEEEDGPDQPEGELEESDDHDASDEPETDEVVDEKASETEEEGTDEASDAEEEDSSEDAEAEDEEPQPAQMYQFKANGKDYEFSSDEIVTQFPKIFGQAMDYTKKMQTIKPWRKTIDALEGAALGHSDVSLMIDVLKGDKEAIQEVMRRTGVDSDALDLEAEDVSPYEAKDYGRDDSALAIKDIVDVISQDVEYGTTHNILSKEWDERSWATMTENPEMIRLLHTDVKSGMYQQLQPLAEKLKVFGGGTKSDLDYYKEAAQQHFARTAQDEALKERNVEREGKREAATAEKTRLSDVKAKTEQRNATKKASTKRKAAAPTKGVSAGRDVVDYLEEDDEAFDEWYKKLQDSA